MKKEKANTFKLGLFVTLAVTLFVVAVYYIGNEQNLFQPTFQLNAVFQNAEGLKLGNNVRYAGIDAGTVKEIEITSDSTLRVGMKMKSEMQAYIKKNAIASIGSDGLVGSKIINISPAAGKEPAPLVEDQDYIKSYSRLATNDMLGVLGKTNENIALFSLRLLEISEKINSGSGTMNMLLQDSLLALDLRQAIVNLKFTTSSLRKMGEEMRQSLYHLNNGDGLMHSLLYDTSVITNVKSLTSNLEGLMTQKVEPVLFNLQRSAENMEASSISLKEMLEQINKGEGTLGALVRDPEMENDLKQILENINQSSARFNENMEAMRHHFLFRGYFKKMEKAERKSLKK